MEKDVSMDKPLKDKQNGTRCYYVSPVNTEGGGSRAPSKPKEKTKA